VSLLVFLSFELHRRYSHKSWWQYVLYLNDLAMLAIFYHGLRLGSQLQAGWYVPIWYLYGITLAFFIGFGYARKWRIHHPASS
jgi:hypothetical protein